jgi:hypothetical protein
VPGERLPAAGLQALGLTAAEDVAYELLLDRSPCTPEQLAVGWPGPGDPDAALAGLAHKGLAQRLPGSPVRYAAIAPYIAVDALLLAHEEQLRRAREHADRLVAAYRKQAALTDPRTVIEVVTGRSAITQRLRQLRRGAREQIRCLDQPPYVDPLVPDLDLIVDGVTYRTIYDHAAVDRPGALPGIERLVAAGQQARVLPALPMKLYLADDGIALLPLYRDVSGTQAAMVVHPSALLDALGHLFEGLWQRALPLGLPTEATAHAPTADSRLVALLLSGLTDQAIARQLGIGYRTAQRRIAALLADLGADSRFQAGMRAALREPPEGGDR